MSLQNILVSRGSPAPTWANIWVNSINGITGPLGPGHTGLSGMTGHTGLIGPTGNIGNIGVGSTGSTGSTGENGSTGNAGYISIGSTGPTGSTGIIGSTGFNGIIGPRGNTGPTGFNITNYLSMYNTTNQSISSALVTPVTFNTIQSSVGSNISYSVGFQGFYMNSGGIYILSYDLQWSNDGTTGSTGVISCYLSTLPAVGSQQFGASRISKVINDQTWINGSYIFYIPHGYAMVVQLDAYQKLSSSDALTLVEAQCQIIQLITL